jgi:hypothetical protein
MKTVDIKETEIIEKFNLAIDNMIESLSARNKYDPSQFYHGQLVALEWAKLYLNKTLIGEN